MKFLDYLYPKFCIGCKQLGTYLCPTCFTRIQFVDELICLACNKPAIDGMTHPKCQGKYIIDGAVASLSYKGIVRKLLYTFKYKPYVRDLQETIGDLFYEGIIQQEIFMRTADNDAILMPIPLHKDKLRTRGYNQARLLADDIGTRLELTVVDGLVRVRKTVSQYALTREQRQKNIKDAFALQSGIDVKGKTVFLIDDLYTSGTTLLEAANVLKRNGAKKVWGVTLAHGK